LLGIFFFFLVSSSYFIGQSRLHLLCSFGFVLKPASWWFFLFISHRLRGIWPLVLELDFDRIESELFFGFEFLHADSALLGFFLLG
jgi:hypothetical protein